MWWAGICDSHKKCHMLLKAVNTFGKRCEAFRARYCLYRCHWPGFTLRTFYEMAQYKNKPVVKIRVTWSFHKYGSVFERYINVQWLKFFSHESLHRNQFFSNYKAVTCLFSSIWFVYSEQILWAQFLCCVKITFFCLHIGYLKFIEHFCVL